MTTRVALYTRVSTEDQAKEGFSLDAQLDRLHKFAEAQGWHVAGEFVDEGHSGRTTRRPAYQRMLAESDSWDTILVLKMDRIHRNSRNFMAMMDGLTRDDKGFASVTESLDTATAMGRFVMDIIQRIAQLESEQIGERVYVGMDQKAKTSGGSLGKPAPFGYQYNEESILEPVQSEVKWVEGVYERFLKGHGKQQIADWLNQAGVKTRRARHWTVWNITAILTNPTYAGALQWEDHLQLDAHTPIVAPSTFDDAQRRIRSTSPRKRLHFLQGLGGENPASIANS